jgi:hypothetical protein
MFQLQVWLDKLSERISAILGNVWVLLFCYSSAFGEVTLLNDDLNGAVVSNADCLSNGPGFESWVSHGPFQKVKHWIDNPSCKK